MVVVLGERRRRALRVDEGVSWSGQWSDEALAGGNGGDGGDHSGGGFAGVERCNARQHGGRWAPNYTRIVQIRRKVSPVTGIGTGVCANSLDVAGNPRG